MNIYNMAPRAGGKYSTGEMPKRSIWASQNESHLSEDIFDPIFMPFTVESFVFGVYDADVIIT
jgi:hypothetical protein